MADDGGYIHPSHRRVGDTEMAQGGLTKREWFAGQAMAALIGQEWLMTLVGMPDDDKKTEILEDTAKIAFAVADQMVREARK